MFDDTNGFGYIPDSLPQTYGYKDAQPGSVRQNMPTAGLTTPFNPIGTAQMVASNPVTPTLRPTYNGGMPSGSLPYGSNPHAAAMRRPAPPAAVNYADLADDDDDDDDDDDAYGAFWNKEDPNYPILKDAAGRKYRKYVGEGGYEYAQYEDGKYAILKTGLNVKTKKPNPLPTNVKVNMPFDAAKNEKAFKGIEEEVEGAIGPFPKGAKAKAMKAEAKAAKKAAKAAGKAAPAKGKKKGGGGGAAIAEALARGATTALVQNKKFKPSDEDTTPMEAPVDLPSAPGSEDEDVAWYAKKALGIPTWGWIAGGVVLVGGTALLFMGGKKKEA
jgi:hypothetical protein